MPSRGCQSITSKDLYDGARGIPVADLDMWASAHTCCCNACRYLFLLFDAALTNIESHAPDSITADDRARAAQTTSPLRLDPASCVESVVAVLHFTVSVGTHICCSAVSRSVSVFVPLCAQVHIFHRGSRFSKSHWACNSGEEDAANTGRTPCSCSCCRRRGYE